MILVGNLILILLTCIPFYAPSLIIAVLPNNKILVGVASFLIILIDYIFFKHLFDGHYARLFVYVILIWWFPVLLKLISIQAAERGKKDVKKEDLVFIKAFPFLGLIGPFFLIFNIDDINRWADTFFVNNWANLFRQI